MKKWEFGGVGRHDRRKVAKTRKKGSKKGSNRISKRSEKWQKRVLHRAFLGEISKCPFFWKSFTFCGALETGRASEAAVKWKTSFWGHFWAIFRPFLGVRFFRVFSDFGQKVEKFGVFVSKRICSPFRVFGYFLGPEKRGSKMGKKQVFFHVF